MENSDCGIANCTNCAWKCKQYNMCMRSYGALYRYDNPESLWREMEPLLVYKVCKYYLPINTPLTSDFLYRGFYRALLKKHGGFKTSWW